MAYPGILHVSPPKSSRSAAKCEWKTPRLLKIEHPSVKQAKYARKLSISGLSSRQSSRQSEVEGLLMSDVGSPPSSREVSHLGSSGGRRPATYPGRESRRRSVPLSPRPATQGSVQGAAQMRTDELVQVIAEKLRRGSFFTLRHAFRAFDPQGNGTVTKEAFYRILCNFLSGITMQQFTALISRLDLAHKKVISFEEFFSKFHVSKSQPRWLDPVTRHSPRLMSASQVHSQLKERARSKILSLSDFLPSSRGISSSLVTKPEFRNMLHSLSFHMSDEEFEKLWTRYDAANKGMIEVKVLLTKLGINVTKPTTPAGHSGKPDVHQMQLKLNSTYQQVLQRLRELDGSNSGKVSEEQLRRVFAEFGVKITPSQMSELIGRIVGMQQEGYRVDYTAFLRGFAERRSSGLVDTIMTNPSQRFHVAEKGRACTSAGDAETRIVTLLQHKFFDLLAAFKSHDPHGKGYIKTEDFVKCIYKHLEVASASVDMKQLVASLCANGAPPGLVPYPKFLSLFETPSGQTKRPQTHTQCDDLRTAVQPQKIPDVETLLSLVSEVVLKQTGKLTEAFVTLDTRNTGRLTYSMMKELLQRFGIKLTEAELRVLWDSQLKNKDATVSFHEFLRHFGSRPATTSSYSKPTRRLTEDHFFMRSKTLHRDEDMVLENLKAKISYYSESLLSHFKFLDVSNTGRLDSVTFEEALLQLCPELSEWELVDLTTRTRDVNGQIPYEKFLSLFAHPVCPTYQSGSNMARLLAQRRRNAISATLPPPMITQQPVYGLPGVKAQLQKQLYSQWRPLRRLFRGMDKGNTGLLTIAEFRSVLSHCGIHLSKEQLFHILEALDPQLTGKVNYQHFINVMLE